MKKKEDYYKRLHKQNEKDGKFIIKIFLVIAIIMAIFGYNSRNKVFIDRDNLKDTIITIKEDTLKIKIYKD
jgi:hypothetical protein